MMTKGILASLAFAAFAGAVLFGCAGRTDVPQFWGWLAFLSIASVAFLPLANRLSPGLIEERMRPGGGDRDRFGQAFGVLQLVATLAIAGLDAGRFHWAAPLPPAVFALAWGAVVAGFAIVAWAMLVNRYFSSAIRIQSDRGQVVVERGPYAWVRHPGYLGGLLFMGFTGLALGSWWAALTALPALPWMLRRTGIEDAMLRSELEGYDDYAGRVRFRLVPGLW